jgi:ketosteroid isomerase-like protein
VEFLAQGDKVIVLGNERMRVKSNGQSYKTDWVHVWTVRRGKVAAFAEYTDTEVIVEVFKGK